MYIIVVRRDKKHFEYRFALRASINRAFSIRFTICISVIKGKDMKFVWKSQTIKVTNVDNKIDWKRSTQAWKHAIDFYTRFICGSSNCSKTNMLISLLESPYDLRFENVYMYLKLLQQSKYRYLENLLTMIEEIGYFTFSNNSDVVPPIRRF